MGTLKSLKLDVNKMKLSTQLEYEDVAKHYIDISCRTVCELIDLHDFELAFSKLDWSTRRRCSRGGWYPRKGGAGISISMSVAAKPTNNDVVRVYEYKSFDASPVIGGFYTRNTEDKIALHCLHEVAHAAQYWGYYLKKLSPGEPHGAVWKNIYSHLRRSILNPRLPNQKSLSEEYKSYIESIESPLQRKLMGAYL